MKKIRNLLFILLTMVALIPFGVRAEEEKKKVEKEPVPVYLFYGNGCQYCEATLEWFNTIEDKYGDYYDLHTYEVWYSEDSAALMEEVAELRGDNASGVPYIIVGDYSYPNGFASDTVVDEESGKTMGDQLIEQILEVYEDDNRYDVMVEVNNKPNYNNVVGIVSAVVIIGFVAMVIVARKQSK